MTLADRATDDSRSDTGTPRERLARFLSATFSDRNYTLPYLARRCRTTEDAVERWLTGVSIPSVNEWNFLCSVSGEFRERFSLWEDARLESRIRHDLTAGDAESAPSASLVDDVSRVVESILPAPPVVGPSLDSPPGVPAIEPDEDPRSRPLSTTSSLDGTSTRLPTPRRSPRRGSERDADRVLPVPEDFVVYGCKIGRGRFVQIPLPLHITRVDVDRLYAFLLTQVDEDAG